MFKVIDLIDELTHQDMKSLEKYFHQDAITVFKVLPNIS